LFVGGSELFWQCRRGRRRESNHKIFYDLKDREFQVNNKNSDANWHLAFPEHWPMESRLFEYGSFSNPDTAHKRWRRLISSYTRRLLTFQSDKLPAISAMAQRFTGLFEKEEDRPKPADYCCGWWQQTLLEGLLWKTSEYGEGECGAFRHPSWSWAASEGPVLFCTGDPNPIWYADVLDVSIELESQLSPFGAVRSGKVTLFGPVAWLPDAIFERHNDNWTRFHETGQGEYFQYRSSSGSSGEVWSHEDRIGDRDPKDEYFAVDTGHPGQPGQKESDHPATATPSTPTTPIVLQIFAEPGKETLATTADSAANSNLAPTSNPLNPQNRPQIPPPGAMPGASPFRDLNFQEQSFNLNLRC